MSVSGGSRSVPLTAGQRARLLAGCVPFMGFGLLVAGYAILVGRAIIPTPPLLFYLFIGVVLLFTGYQALQRLRDILAGVALAQEDLLNRSYRAKGRGSARYYGRFERLGTLRMIPGAHFGSSPGQRYHVVYSPASKIVWALEPAGER